MAMTSHPRLESLSVDVYMRLKEMIATRQLIPGARLVQQTLARQLGTSAMPIVEALRRLERDGLVVHVPHLGSFVREWSAEEVHDLYSVRCGLEPEACRIFVQQATSSERRHLVDLNDQIEASSLAGNQEKCTGADFAFHMHIVTCTHMPRLIATVENCHIEERLLLKQPRLQPMQIATTMANAHETLMQAIADGDEDRAASVLRSHLCQAEQYFLKYIHSV